MQIDHHIRMCPAIAEAGGLEPYPQPTAAFAGAPTGTVQVRLFDTSVQPPVELTSGGAIALGAGLAASGLANLPNSYVLDMGNVGVTGVVNAYTREGLECIVKFEDSGGSQAPVYVKVTCNDADHVAALYPEGAIYAVANSGVTGTAFPNGSIYRPCQNLGDACTVFTNRGAEILDCAGSWNGGGSGSGGCLASDIGSALSSVAGALIRTRSTAAWYPHNSGDVIDLVDCTVMSVNVPFGFAVGNFTNGTYFGGVPKLVNCRIQTSYFTGNGSTRAGGCDATACKFDGDVYLSSYQTPGCWAFDAVGCINGTDVTVDLSSMGGSTATWVDCAGAFQIDNMSASKTLEMSGIKGMPAIVLDATTSNAITVVLTGAYASLTNNTGGALTSLTERRLGAAADITALNDVSTAEVQAAAEAAVGAQEPIDANVTQVAGGAVAGVADFRATGFAVAGDAMALTTAAQDAIRDARLWVRADGGPVATPGSGASPILYSNGFAAVIRRRLFASAAAAAAATDGEADGTDGEVHVEYLRSTQSGSNAYPSHFREVGT